jgi:hypothetical protein
VQPQPIAGDVRVRGDLERIVRARRRAGDRDDRDDRGYETSPMARDGGSLPGF